MTRQFVITPVQNRIVIGCQFLAVQIASPMVLRIQ